MEHAPRAVSAAARLLELTRRELEPVERAVRAHPVLYLLEAGRVGRAGLRLLADWQAAVVSSDRRSFACLAARFPEPPAGDLFLRLAEGEGQALAHLAELAAWLGPSDDRGDAGRRPPAGAQAYPAFVAWLALNGRPSQVALAFLVNLDAWGANCGRVAAALRDRCAAPAGATAFFDFFAEPPADAAEQQLRVLQAGLDAGERPDAARWAAAVLQHHELGFWDAWHERVSG